MYGEAVLCEAMFMRRLGTVGADGATVFLDAVQLGLHKSHLFFHGGYLLILALAADSALAGDGSFGGLMFFVALGGASSC